ncbi:HAMP domain-containing sensor histidine kinase [Desulfobacterales bacterium HSG2]|nr:HAMP domain-containing sensor histidine kinase [Desulfobacterales bacterium HSG2]
MSSKKTNRHNTRLSEFELTNALYFAVEFAKGDWKAKSDLQKFFPKGYRSTGLPNWWYCELACNIVEAGCLERDTYPTWEIVDIAKLTGPSLWYALAIAESHFGDETGCRLVLEGIVKKHKKLQRDMFECLKHSYVPDIGYLKSDILEKLIPLFPNADWYTSVKYFEDDKCLPRSQDAEQWKELATLFEDVIHELSQPVATIGIDTSDALYCLNEGDMEGVRQSLSSLRLAVQDLGERIGAYKALTQRSSSEETIRVRDIADEVENVLRRRADKAKVKLDIQISDDNKFNRALYVRGDPFLFRIAIRNLVHNAIEASNDPSIPPDRRHVIIRGIYKPSEDSQIFPNGSVIIYVRDKGPGIPPEIREKIFKRGFTTKRGGRGLGLGLSLVQSVAESYNGKLGMLEDVNPGAEFWLQFPAALPPIKS